MKILTRYVIFSILKIAFVTILMFALILAAVELFSRMDSIMNGNIPIASIIYYILLSLPQYLLMVASISFLFAVTYFLSTLTANNEAIPILNAGVGPVRLRIPVFILSVLLTILGAVYQEKAVIAINAERSEVETELFGASSTRDARNIVLTDPDGYLIFTDRFSEADASKTQGGYEQLDLYTDYAVLDAKRKKEQADLEHEQKMRFFGNHLEEHLAIAVTFFIPDAKKTSGSHAAKTG